MEVDKTAPKVVVKLQEINVFGGYKVAISKGGLSIGDKEVASWSDDKTAAADLKVEVTFAASGTSGSGLGSGSANPTALNTGDTIDSAGTLSIMVTDEGGNASKPGDVKVLSIAIFGLDDLSSMDLQVGQEVNLLQGLSFADGVTLNRVDVCFE